MVWQAANETGSHEDHATLREQAADWVLRLEEAGPETRERLVAECEAWQATDPLRRQVLEQMQRMWSAVTPAPARRRRRAAGLGLLMLLAGVTGTQLPWNLWTADYRTAAGEIRDITLPDGSTLVLNSDSAIDIDYGDDRRRIRLERGELLVRVDEDPARRAFEVTTAHGAAVALGTRYGVRLDQAYTDITVHESRVRLLPRDAAAPGEILAGGQRARLTPGAVIRVVSARLQPPDWADRRLVFNDAPLAEVVERLGQYRQGWLLLDADLTHRHLRFTGVVPAEDSDAALSVLADALSLELRSVTPYLVWLHPSE
ncbi:MAG: FecR domain-containing protein [Gammaproteobacteria bacterium]|nr:FecR domain-containing protein [Gammaproteobacteria bacterium]